LSVIAQDNKFEEAQTLTAAAEGEARRASAQAAAAAQATAEADAAAAAAAAQRDEQRRLEAQAASVAEKVSPQLSLQTLLCCWFCLSVPCQSEPLKFTTYKPLRQSAASRHTVYWLHHY